MSSDARVERKPLDGVRVVDFGQLIAGPGAAGVLAALGAEVIKVEPVGGEAGRQSGSYGNAIVRTFNRGKRSIALDLRSAEGQTVALRLAASADVVVQNMRPGAMTALGLGHEELREKNPRLIYASVSGFPSDGPSRNRAGLDIAAQAESGMMSMTGEPGRDPQRVGYPVVDVAASTQLAQGVLAALFVRERSGVGDHVHVSLLEAAVHLQGPVWAEADATGIELMRSGNGQPTVAPAADVIRVADGDIVLSAYTPAHWRRLCDVIGRPGLLDDPRFADNPSRVRHRTELLELLHQALSGYSRAELLARLTDHGIVAGAIRTIGEVPTSPDALESGMFLTASDSLGGHVAVPRLPFRLHGWSEEDGDVPLAGEHTEQILTDVGLSETEIASLVECGAVSAFRPRVDA